MRIGFRTPPSLQVTPNQSEPAFSSAFATSGPPWPYPFPFTIERILRGVLRFSSGGFTYFRMAWRLYVKAERETSAQTGRLTSLWGLLCIDRFAVMLPFDRFAVMFPVVAMSSPKKIVYDIHDARAGGHIGCRLKDNTLLHCKPKAFRIRSPRAGSNNSFL